MGTIAIRPRPAASSDEKCNEHNKALLAEGFVFEKQRGTMSLLLKGLTGSGGSTPAAQNAGSENQE
jgi:hypothetical protein